MISKFLKLASLIIVCNLFTFSCNSNNSKENETKTASTQVEVETMAISIEPKFDPILASKEYAKVHGDSLGIQMYEVTLKPGDSVGLHKHLDHSVYVLEGGKLLVYFDGTNPVEMDLPQGFGMISGPVTDAAVNVGETNVTLLMHEILRPRK